MTLIELIIALVLTVTLVGAAGAAFSASIQNQKDTGTSFGDSHDAQLVETYMPVDIQSTGSALTDVDSTFSTAMASGCTGSVPATSTNLLKLTWTAAGVSYTVDYRIEPEGNLTPPTSWKLVRYACDSAHAGVTKTLDVSHEVLAPTPAWPASVVTCGSRVTVTMRQASGYTYNIAANRRTPMTTPATCADFSVAVSPATQSVVRGGAASYTVTVTPVSGFVGTVTLSNPDPPANETTPPPNAVTTFSTTSMTFASASPQTSTFTVTTAQMPIGNTSMTITATGGGRTHSAQASLSVTGAAQPDLLQIEMYDGRNGAGTGAPNGKIDELVALFSLPLSGTCTTTSSWSISGAPAGMSIRSVNRAWPTSTTPGTDPTHVVILLNEGSGFDTAAPDLDVSFTAAGCGANAATAINAIDRAGPVAVSVSSPLSVTRPTNGNSIPQTGDSIEIGFSEPVTSCAPTSMNVTLTSDTSPPKGDDTLTLPGVAQSPTIIGDRYLNNKSKSVAFSASPVSCAGSVLTIVLGVCSGNCADLDSGNSRSYTLQMVAGLLIDQETPVPNSVISTVSVTGGALF